MKRIILVLLALLMAGFVMAEVKFSSGSYVYAYEDFSTDALSFAVNPTVAAAIDKATFTLGAYGAFDVTALTSGYLYLTSAYNFGFASAYATPYVYKSGKFGFDGAVTFNIPHCPLTVEYTIGEGEPLIDGLITAYVYINF